MGFSPNLKNLYVLALAKSKLQCKIVGLKPGEFSNHVPPAKAGGNSLRDYKKLFPMRKLLPQLPLALASGLKIN